MSVGCAQGSWASESGYSGVKSALASFGRESYARYMVDAMANSWTRNLGSRLPHCDGSATDSLGDLAYTNTPAENNHGREGSEMEKSRQVRGSSAHRASRLVVWEMQGKREKDFGAFVTN